VRSERTSHRGHGRALRRIGDVSVAPDGRTPAGHLLEQGGPAGPGERVATTSWWRWRTRTTSWRPTRPSGAESEVMVPVAPATARRPRLSPVNRNARHAACPTSRPVVRR